MAETTSTPGPWRIEPAVPGEASGTHVFAANPGGSAGDFVTIADFVDNEANARLIAAAPELLAALKTLLSVLPDNWGDAIKDGVLPAFHLLAEDMDSALAAIAKAEGR